MDYLPYHLYHDEKHVAELQHAIQGELDRLQEVRNDLYGQLHPSTATWGLALFEKDYGIQPIESKPSEQRLANWRAKRRGRSTTTEELIRSIAETYTKDPVEILVYPSQYGLEIKVPDVQGIPDYLPDMMALIWEIRPAHLGMGYRVPMHTDGITYAAGGHHHRIQGHIPLEYPTGSGNTKAALHILGTTHRHILGTIPLDATP